MTHPSYNPNCSNITMLKGIMLLKVLHQMNSTYIVCQKTQNFLRAQLQERYFLGHMNEAKIGKDSSGEHS